MSARRLILVFARPPREETRAKPLVPGARERDVEALHRGLFRRTLSAARSTGIDTRLVTTGDARLPLLFPGLQIVPQIGRSFSERLESAVADAFSEGWQQVVLIGGDTPGLEARHLTSAFDSLGDATGRRAVFGPSPDGGYYLLGLNAFEPAAFRDVALGTSEAGAATVAALARTGFSVAIFAPLRDVDDAADVRALASRPGALRAAAALVLAVDAAFSDAERAAPPVRFASTIQVRGPPAAP